VVKCHIRARTSKDQEEKARVACASSVPSRGCGGGSAKNKALRILDNASEVISPRMRRSFIDRQYSPSTGMDWSEWEIILEDLIHMDSL
jgi:hypothetical protein